MLLQHLRYLVALAREKHFARAAEACQVAQPTLSEGIRQLEEDLGVPIVERRQRYQGLTPAGERVLTWAHRILADYESLSQEVGELREGLVGKLTLAAIPATHPVVARLTTPLIEAHPKLSVMVLSQTSVEIQRSLDDFSVDAGLTYLDNEPLERVKTQALYRERYVLVTQADGPFGRRTEVSWKEAATLRLCLLAEAMQNRRIIDGIFLRAGATPRPPVETMSLLTVCAHVALGGWATILPHTFGPLVRPLPNVAVLPLVSPSVEHVIGLAVAKRDPLPPLVRALLEVARGVTIDAASTGPVLG
jgi:DNA-binding transcriptional LysR family regulator